MTKDDLYRALTARGLKSGQAKALTDGFFRLIISELRLGKTVSLKNFATFVVRHKGEIRIMNNRTKKAMDIPSHKVVQAKFSRLLKNLMIKNSRKNADSSQDQ
jgi:nucleoid DNA-binding protein